MKKFATLCAVGLLAATLVFAFTGCDTNTPGKPVVTLDLQDGSAPKQVEPPFGNYISGKDSFEAPTRDDWFFNGWFLDKACTVSAHDTRVTEDITVYAGWTDTITVAMNQTADSVPYTELFDISITASAASSHTNLFVTVTPKKDFTGANSTEKFEIQVSLRWLSDEQFMGEYVSDEVVAHASAREIYLEKSNGYTLTNFKTAAEPVPAYVFNNQRTVAVINYVFDEPTLQCKHK